MYPSTDAIAKPDLTQADLKLVGHYALSMTFSDGHHTGIFSFGFLRRLSPVGG